MGGVGVTGDLEWTAAAGVLVHTKYEPRFVHWARVPMVARGTTVSVLVQTEAREVPRPSELDGFAVVVSILTS